MTARRLVFAIDAGDEECGAACPYLDPVGTSHRCQLVDEYLEHVDAGGIDWACPLRAQDCLDAETA